MKGFGKIEAVVKSQRVCDRGDRQAGVLQQIARLLHAEIRQIFLGGEPQDSLKRAEQMTAAHADVAGDILHGDGVGIIRGDVLNAFLYIAVRGILASGVRGAVHEQGEHGVKTSRHLYRVLEFVAARIVDVQNLPVNIVAAGGVTYKRIFRGEIRGLQDHGGVASGKTDPSVFPGILLIRAVDNLGVRVDQKGVSSGQVVGLTGDAVGTFSGDDIVDQIVIADTGTPLIEGVAFLEADVVDGEGD